jgi:hypothetical protein
MDHNSPEATVFGTHLYVLRLSAPLAHDLSTSCVVGPAQSSHTEIEGANTLLDLDPLFSLPFPSKAAFCS